MSKPPTTFQREPGATTPLAPCGWTWFKSHKVTGEIPKTGGFGKHIETTLDPVVKNQDLPSDFGHLSKKEDEAIDKVTNRIAMVDHWVDKGLEDGWLEDKEAVVLRWLLSHAESHIESVDEIYDKWMHRDAVGNPPSAFHDGVAGGAWPLSQKDSIIDFAGGACKGHNYNDIVEIPGGHGGAYVRCPLPSEIEQRPKDRKAIKNHIMDAIYNTRCAEWGLWRIKLYREAREEYLEQHGIDDYGVTPPGITPIPGMGGFQAGEVGPGAGGPGGYAAPYIPPENPDDFVLPDPKDLPPPDQTGPQRVGGSDPVRVGGKPPTRVAGSFGPEGSSVPPGVEPAQGDASRFLVPAAALGALGWILLSR